ncbi:MAG: beta galactosidase jelly roll domain-containing protein [Oscillospiraceae bacterium]|nr:beta galactosidase jelly roll domain-containing protein [Oscillospiraceae bacterium]
MKIRPAYINDPHINTFDPAQFAAPGAADAVIYAWVWNAPVDRQGICERLDEMQRMGIRALYIIPEPKTFRPAIMPTTMEPDYLTPPYFELFAFAMQEAGRRGMRTWLYDEGGWPSGGACGKVLQENPRLAKRILASRAVTLAAQQPYAPAEDALAAFGEDGVLCTAGTVFEKETALREYYVHRQLFEGPGIPDYPDLHLRESCEAFLSSTHEKYAAALPDQLGKNMTAVFTDEAKAPGPVPFSLGMQERFESEYGYSVLPYLPALEKWLQPEAPALAPDAARAAADFYELASRMLCENWLQPQKEWCNRHGMCFTGHMDRDDEPCAGMIGFCWYLLRALRQLDIPGVDVIWRQLWPGEPIFSVQGTQSNGFFPRYAASAAAQTGSPYALTETAGVYGNGLTPARLRWLLGYQAVRGINRFNLMIIPYSTDGWLMGGEQPAFREHNACYGELAPFNEWGARLAWAASAGRRAADIALYQPVRDIWAGAPGAAKAFDAAGRALDASGVEFDVFDDDVLESADPAALAAGCVQVGLARYRALVLPTGAPLPEASAAALRTFMAGGGRVYCTGRECALPGAVCVPDAHGLFAPPLPLRGDTAGIRVSRRELADGTLYIVFNEKDAPAAFGLQLPDTDARRLWLEDGRITACAAAPELTLQSGEVAVFLCGECAAALAAKEEPVFNRVLPIDGEWSIRPVKRLHLGEIHVETLCPDEPAKPAALGDWQPAVGADYSGSCLYETSFALESVPAEAALELGEVKYTCEVWLNGTPLGKKVMPPFRFALPAGVLQRQNILQVRVTNTAANEYAHTRTLDKWQPWQRADHYYQKELEFDRDAYESGLYGPVRLVY